MKKLFPEIEIREICDWLIKQLPRFSAAGLVFEVCGDLDSAVAAALARRALGSQVLGIIINLHGPEEAAAHARQVVQLLAIPHQVVDLAPAYERLLAVLPPAPSRKVLEALKSRLRMLTLYHYAARHHYLVMGCVSRSDWEVASFAPHGRGAADLQPLMHLLKHEVLELARHLDLPTQLAQRFPAAVTMEGDPDESNAGFSYLDLDALLEGDTEVPEGVRLKIQIRRQDAASRRHPALKIPVAVHLTEGERHDQEVYDKSIEALTLISQAITSDQYLEDILRLIVMVTAEVMNSSVCSLWLLDDKEAVLRLRATQSIDSEYLKERVLRVGEGIVGKVVAENKPYIAVNVLDDPHYKEKELARSMGLVSMISVPMRVKDRVIGVINCYTSHPHVFSDLQMNVFTAVAGQAAVAIENTELMVKTKVIQEELENRKLIERAKDLIMKRLGLPGDDAYRWLQRRSMNTRKSMRQVAEAVLLTMEA